MTTEEPIRPFTFGPVEHACMNAVAHGANVFITGAGGTGKTTLLRKIVTMLRRRRLALTSPSGAAAQILGGSTVHHWAGFGKGPPPGVDFDRYINDQYWDRPNLVRAGFRRVHETDVLVIDEVSMIDGRLLDFIDRWCREARANSLPFGGMQVVLSGDFMQLPPVNRGKSNRVDWAFTSKAWRAAEFQHFKLVTVRRQTDARFVQALMRAREGEIDRDVFGPMVVDHPPEGAVRLYAKNEPVNAFNAQVIGGMKGEETEHHAIIEGDDKWITTLITPRILAIKRGCRVMFTANDKKRRFANGTQGTVIRSVLDPVVRTDAGTSVTLERRTWEEEAWDGTPLGNTFSQYPLKPCYAMTIHKAQGASFDNVFADISGCRTPGQAYVALSRARTPEGLSLATLPDSILCSREALAFDRSI